MPDPDDSVLAEIQDWRAGRAGAKDEPPKVDEPKVEPPKVEPKVEPPVPSAAPPKWESVDDVDTAAVPEAARSWVEAVLPLVHMERAALDQAKSSFVTKTRELDEFLAQLKDTDPEKGEPLAQVTTQFQQAQQALGETRNEMTHAIWLAFQARNPDFDTLPDGTKSLFATLVERGTWASMEGANYVERMEETLRFARYKTGLPPTGVLPGTRSTAPAVPAPPTVQASQAARHAAAVAQGRLAPGTPNIRPDERKPDEILDQHERLLTEYK